MPRQWVEIITCSLCGGSSQDHLGADSFVEVKLEITGEGSWELDVCSDCRNSTALAELVSKGIKLKASRKPLAKKGEPVEGPPTDHNCPECGASYSTAPGLNQHRSRKHGVLSDYAAGMAQRGTGPIKCKIKGCDFGATAPQGIAAHMRSKHPKQFAVMQEAKQSA